MNMVEGKIVHLLTGKNSLAEVTVNELKTIADSQPYFSVAQLLLAKKMKQDNHPEYLQQVQKTALYFPNVHWLHYQLNDDEFKGSSEESKTSDTTESLQPEEKVPSNETENLSDSSFNTVQENEIEVDVDREIFIPSAAPEQEKSDTTLTEVYSAEQSNADEDVIADTEPLPAEASSKLSEMIEQQVKEFNKEVTPESKLPIEPEPFHTVDYFASQGIKLNAQQMQQDQLGSRVRKFTDWLKQMKRVQSEPADLGTDPELEHVVQDIADTSNKAREIVTEAMAEVLVKQGKAEKAIQLYIKLSFLNPDKSAYFAAKIQELKGI